MHFKDTHVLMVCGTVVILAIVGAIYGYHTTQIEAEKSVVETELHEKADVEQTEERSQFWQKLVPWGSDEDESDSSPVVEDTK